MAAVMVLLAAPGIDSQEELRRDQTFVFKGIVDNPPYEYYDGDAPTGYSVEFLHTIARTMGLNVHIELAPWPQVQEEFQAGEIDGILSYPQFEHYFYEDDFLLHHSRRSYALFARRRSTVTGLDDIAGGTLLLPEDDVVRDRLQATGFTGTIREAGNATQVLRELAMGQGDGALVDYVQGTYLCRKYGLRHLVAVEEDLFSLVCTFAVTEQNGWLRERLIEGAKIAGASGDRMNLYMDWIHENMQRPQSAYLQYLPGILAAILLLLAVILGWAYLLRLQVRNRTEALRKNEERYRTLFENSGDALFLYRDIFIDCNQRACELLGYSREEILSKSPADLSPPTQPDGRESVLAARVFTDAAMAGPPQLFDWVHQKKSGQLVDVEVSLRKIPGMKTAACLGAVRDLSERKEAERRVRHEQNLVRAVMETSPVGIVTLNSEGIIIFANARTEDILHLKRSDILERRYDDPRFRITDIHGEPFQDEDFPFHQVMRTGEPVYDFRHGMEHSNGERAILSLNAAPLFDEAGCLSDVVVTIEDITANIRTEEEREARWRRIQRQQAALIEVAGAPAMSDGDFEAICVMITALAAETLDVTTSSVWLFDGGRTRLNHVAGHARGGKRQQQQEPIDAGIIPNYISALESGRNIDAADAHRDPRTVQLLENYLIPNDVGALLDAPIRIGGTMVGIICNEYNNGIRYWKPDELQFVAEMADQAAQAFALRERRLAEEEHRSLEEHMHEAQRLESLGILAGGMAHDFNNLLTAILGNVDLAMMDIPGGNPAETSLREIGTLSSRAADLCRSMLAYAGKGKVQTNPVNLNEEIREIGAMMSASISRSVQMIYHLDKDLPTVEADKRQIHQVLMNLMLNASEAIGTAEGAITVRTYVKMCDHQVLEEVYATDNLSEGPYVAIEVSDTGTGMSKETVEKIFTPFFSTKFVGRGMGLAAVLGIVRGHAGGISVYSRLGEGSIFTVLLPPGNKGISQDYEPKATREALRGPSHVLLVDANGDSKRVTTKILKRLGYQVVHAPGLQEARTCLSGKSTQVDCVLIDHAFHEMLAEEVIKQLHSDFPEIPLLLATDLEPQETRDLHERLGLAGVLRKPIRVATLAARLNAVIAD